MTSMIRTLLLVMACLLVACAGKPETTGRTPRPDEGPFDVDRPAEVAGDAASDVAADPGPVRFSPFEGIVVDRQAPAVEVAAEVCLDAGWLEQVACGTQSREHESLVVIEARPSNLHAAMLLAGFEPGAPGRWELVNERLVETPPRGDPIEVFVQYENAEGTLVEHSVRRWIRDHAGQQEFPATPWVFGGSLIAPNPEWMEPGEHYVADFSGSIIGLVTFGDEVIGYSRVLSDQQEIQPPEWEAWTERLPPIGTPVTVILRRPDGG